MTKIKLQYITDEKGNKISVVLPVKYYEALLEELEELEDIKLYDEAKKGKQEFIDAAQAFKEIEQERNQTM
jgi:hypothetical protein